MTKQNKIIFAGLLVLTALLSTSIVFNTVSAQEFDRERPQSERIIPLGIYLAGSGAEVSEDNQGWRSHFRIGLEKTESNDNGHTNYEAKRGVFVVGKHDQRHSFSVIPNTWEISVNQNEKSFDASGKAENLEGIVYDIDLSGEEISDLTNGNLYYVKGTATGPDGEVYNLFYISSMVDRSSIQTTQNGI